jgi:hypothetical protein
MQITAGNQVGYDFNAITLNYYGSVKMNNSLAVAGKVNVHNGSLLGINNMQSGSLTIGDITADYGGSFYTSGTWTETNTAGLSLQCLNNTEIVVHDNNYRLTSLIYCEG